LAKADVALSLELQCYEADMQATSSGIDRLHCMANEGGGLWMIPISRCYVVEQHALFMRENSTKSTVDTTIESARTRLCQRRMLKMKDHGA
jgi:hypothetical protein